MIRLTRRELLVDGARASVLGAASSLLPPAAAGLGPSGSTTEARPPAVSNSGDAYVHFDAATQAWSCGTNLIEQRLQLSEGKFSLAALTNRLTGSEYVAGRVFNKKDEGPADTNLLAPRAYVGAIGSDEFHFLFGGREYSGHSGGYKLRDFQIMCMPVPKASPGIEPGVTLVVNLEHPFFLISLHYDVFASTPRTQLGMIRKWYQVTNRTEQVQPLTGISMNRLLLRPEDSQRFTLYSWVGGGAGKDTNLLQSESLSHTKARTFYSMSGQPDYRADDVYDGSSSYHPYFVLEDPKAGDGVFFGFNYLGPWSVRIWNPGDHMLRTEGARFPVQSQLELHTEPLKPGITFEV
ncbi:MAG: hypothetical protein WB341_14935, partial [Terracidiphilus sp.]